MRNIRINEYTLTDYRIKKNYNVVLLSDLHSNTNFIKLYSSLLKKINSDFTCISGDIIDTSDNKKNEILLKYLKDLSEYFKVYLTLGNHDFIKNGNKAPFFDILKKESKCMILDKEFNCCEYDESININAISVPKYLYLSHEDNYEYDTFISKIKSEINLYKFNILLQHSPNTLIRDNKIVSNLEIINNMQLILCGHNHGGLTPKIIEKFLKNHIGIIGPYCNLFAPSSYGYYTNDRNSLLISDGITKVSDSCPLHYMKWILNKIYIPDIEIIYIKEGNKHNLKLNNSYITRI